MIFSYGSGKYIEGSKHFTGEIILSEYKVYLRDKTEDYSQTFIPLDKVVQLKVLGNRLFFFIMLSVSNQYTPVIEGEKKLILELAKDIANRRGFKKKFLKNEWVEVLP